MAESSQSRILVVDDSIDSAESLAALLQLNGHETRVAHDGLTAIEVTDQFRPDVVLLDIGLPKLSGVEVCRQIRGRPWGANMFILALTGWSQHEDRHRSKEAGFNGHLVKPVDFAGLQKLLAEFLQNRQPQI